jgi:hypothetical protein
METEWRFGATATEVIWQRDFWPKTKIDKSLAQSPLPPSQNGKYMVLLENK